MLDSDRVEQKQRTRLRSSEERVGLPAEEAVIWSLVDAMTGFDACLEFADAR